MQLTPILIGEGLVGQAALTGKVILMEPTAASDAEGSTSVLGKQRSLIALPVTTADGELYGVLQARPALLTENGARSNALVRVQVTGKLSTAKIVGFSPSDVRCLSCLYEPPSSKAGSFSEPKLLCQCKPRSLEPTLPAEERAILILLFRVGRCPIVGSALLNAAQHAEAVIDSKVCSRVIDVATEVPRCPALASPGFTSRWLHLSHPATTPVYPRQMHLSVCPSPSEAETVPDRRARHDLRCWQLFSTYDAHALSARIKSFALQLAPAADACAVTTKREKRREVSALRRRSNGTSAALPRTAAVGHPVRTTIMQCAGPSPLRIWTWPAQHLCARFAGTSRARAR
jgi:hypothetical protein